MSTRNRSILVISEVAPTYGERLVELGIPPDLLTIADSARAATEAYDGQEILLGEPDLIARALPSMPAVRWVQSAWAGVTPLLEPEFDHVIITGVKGVFGAQMAEFVLAYILAREKRLFERLDQQRRRKWWARDCGRLEGKILAILGTGSIGVHIARAARHLGMETIGLSRSGNEVEGFKRVYPVADLNEFLTMPDYLVAVLPDTRETDRLLDAAAFRAMPRHAYLINVGRGNVIDERALIRALERGDLAGAVLDVFAEEPLPANSPLWEAPNLLVTAHIAARSEPGDIGTIFADNFRRWVAGKPLNHVIDRSRGY